MSIQSTAAARRRLAIETLGRELNSGPSSAAGQLRKMLDQPRPMVVSADIDGLVSAAMLASVGAEWEIVAFVRQSADLVLEPSVAAGMPDDLVAIDLYSVNHDSISNHVVKWGNKQPRLKNLGAAFQAWDQAVNAVATQHLQAVPSIWAGTQGSYEEADRPTSSKFKYPLGTAQFLLAMLEVSGHAPKFYDRHYLPWLVADCDGGVGSYTRYAYNARIWWPIMASAVGPASLTEQIFQMVDRMRPHEYLDTISALDREVQASGQTPWLSDDWNLRNTSPSTIETALTWLTELTGWPDPVRGGISSLSTWVQKPVAASATVDLTGPKRVTAATEANAVAKISAATGAINANFYHGGYSGSRFNWVGGW